MMRLAITMAAAVALSGLGWSGAALAQDAAAPAPAIAAVQDDPVKLDLARQLVALSGGQEGMNARVKSIFTAAEKSVAQYMPADQTKLVTAMYQDIEDEFSKLTPQFIDISVRAYAETYTTQELRDQLAFQMSDSGRSIASKAPLIRDQMMKEIVPLMLVSMPAILNKTADRVCAKTQCTPAQRQMVADAMAKATHRTGG